MSEGCGCTSADRYISFQGIDCAGNAHRIMARIDQHLSIAGRSTLFWDYFLKKRAAGSGPAPDDLFLLHSHINQVRELFETWDDQESLQLLVQLEEECC